MLDELYIRKSFDDGIKGEISVNNQDERNPTTVEQSSSFPKDGELSKLRFPKGTNV
jgi:hypothetical protein